MMTKTVGLAINVYEKVRKEAFDTKKPIKDVVNRILLQYFREKKE